jgi:predicted transcriptional regulator
LGYRQVADVLETKVGGGTKRLVMLTVALLSNSEGAVDITQEELGRACECSGATAAKALKELEEEGLVRTEPGHIELGRSADALVWKKVEEPKVKRSYSEDAHHLTRWVFAQRDKPNLQMYGQVLKVIDDAIGAGYEIEIVREACADTRGWSVASFDFALRQAVEESKINYPLCRAAVNYWNETAPTFLPRCGEPLGGDAFWRHLQDFLDAVGKEGFKKAVVRFSDEQGASTQPPKGLTFMIHPKVRATWMVK